MKTWLIILACQGADCDIANYVAQWVGPFPSVARTVPHDTKDECEAGASYLVKAADDRLRSFIVKYDWPTPDAKWQAYCEERDLVR